jgi:hypothetical protein
MRSLMAISLIQVLALINLHASAPQSIAVVHTWGDLQDTPKFSELPVHAIHADRAQKTLPTPTETVTFQVGIADDNIASGSAVLLYFLGQTGSTQPYTPEQWGVFWLQIDGTPWEADTYTLSFQPGDNPIGTLFYSQAIPLPTPGDHVIELIKPYNPEAKPQASRHIIARAIIHVHDEPSSHWYPFWTTQGMSVGAHQGRNVNGHSFALAPVRNPKGDAAVPNTAWPNWYSTFPERDRSLPQFISDDPVGSQVQIQMTDATLVATFTNKIEGFFPDDYFLTRWWVNGKQVELDPQAKAPQQGRILDLSKRESVFQTVAWRGWDRLPLLNIGALVWYTNEVRFNVDFKPDWIGAHPGDRVAVQCLFCPYGFLRFYPPSLFLFTGEPILAEPSFTLTGFSELSNRVEFIYSGDPQHPQR